MSSKGHLNEQIIAVTNWGSRPLGIPLRDCRTYLIIISPKANPCPSLVGVATGTLILLHFQPALLCPVDRESPEAERLKCLCLSLESMSAPAVGDLQSGVGSTWEGHQ